MLKTLLVTVIILGLALTGCGKVRNPTGQSSVSRGTANVNPAAGETTNTANPADTAQTKNDLSASNKTALLSEVDQELDALFNAINNLDDVQDADLDFDLK